MVRTSHNPADIPTRGSTFKNLAKLKLQWHDPDWLVDHSQWPEPPPNVPNFIPKDLDVGFSTLDNPKAESIISDV